MKNKLDKHIERAYYAIAQGKQINIMDIGKLFNEATADVLQRGLTVEQAVTLAVVKYCKEA